MYMYLSVHTLYLCYHYKLSVGPIHVFTLFPCLEHPAGWICVRYKSLLYYKIGWLGDRLWLLIILSGDIAV